ncbi:hypothetical protein NA56DRAFT_753356 [Hyaloscypha hepaticicola]|uniref:Uncharacterized protein n=1 Tax=Hyaloscypha hepaticicola TaxID=2082293 RepID=A0A2J6PQG2_9HELO|nr:hypothetical protein NA56DRAFT_753356 [Hyaloscypha hepaticicola]
MPRAQLPGLDDGQNRVNGALAPAQFCIAGGAITDSNGRGSQVTQFQCDSGAAPVTGFSIGCDRTVAYNGATTSWECQTGDDGEANIYLTPGGTDCGEVSLIADGCFSGCSTPSPGCPTNLNGAYEYPHLIVPIDSSNPEKAVGTSYFGKVSSSISSIPSSSQEPFCWCLT